MGDDRSRLADAWRRFATEQCRGYSPLYERVSMAVAADERVLDLVLGAPLPGWQPNVLLAAVHDLVLAGADHPLAAVYRGDTDPTDVGSLFCDLVVRNRDAVAHLLATRRTNTNECGRSAVIVPALRWATDRMGGEPIAFLDAGASAGLNLYLDRYLLDYGDRGTMGPADAAIRISCALRGDAPVPIGRRSPEIAARLGLDRAPVDLRDPVAARWQLACTWPDTNRLQRTTAAIELVLSDPVEVVEGDLLDDLEATIARLPEDLPLCVVTTWVMAYVRRDDRARFGERLRELSGSRPRPIAWISAEGPRVLDWLPTVPDIASPDGIEPSVLACTRYVAGRSQVEVLGRCHPHGAWLHWTAGS